MTELPKFHETFMPILDILSDGEVYDYGDLRKCVILRHYVTLPDKLMSQKTRNGDLVISNRIGWGKSYLKQAGYIMQPSRGLVQITPKGLAAFRTGSLTLKEVKADPEFIKYHGGERQRQTEASVRIAEEQTPQDMIDSGVQLLEEQTKHEILERLKTVDHFYFEKIVNELFEKMGYGGARTTVKTGDGGIDGIINQDELGLDRIYVQAKRYTDHNVREPDIRNFIGAMSSDTQKGIFVTTSAFDAKAIEKAQKALHKIILIDGGRLAELMYKYGIGVQVKNTYEVKSIDEDYFV